MDTTYGVIAWVRGPIRALLVLTVLSGVLAAQQILSTFHPVAWAGDVTRAEIRDVNASGIGDVLYVTVGASGLPERVSVVYDQGIGALPMVLPTPIIDASLLPIPGTIAWIEVRDFTGDEEDDILFGVTSSATGTTRTYLLQGIGGGAFAAQPMTALAAPITRDPAIGDFNGDGIGDFAVTTPDPGGTSVTVRIYLGVSTGYPMLAFTRPGIAPTAVLAAGDFNHDTVDDLVFGAEILYGFATGSGGATMFGSSVVSTSIGLWSADPASAFTADLDGDGDDDVFFDDQVYRSSPSGVFTQAPVNGATFGNAAHTKKVDLDADGNLDYAVFDATDPAARYVVQATRFFSGNLGFVRLPATSTLPSSGSANSADFGALGDLDGDGDGDVLFVEHAGLSSGIHVGVNHARYGTGCAGAFGIPQIYITTPALGAPAFTIALTNTLPSVLAVLLLSFEATPTTSCDLLVDISPGALILVNGQVIAGLTSPTGTAAFTTPIPSAPQLRGFAFYAQWATLDPFGTFMTGAVTASLSEARTLTVY